MKGMEVIRMTYDDAVHAANDNLTRQHLLKAQDRLISDHFRRNG
jgi:hypothetical protein